MTTLDLSSIDLRHEHLLMTYELLAFGYDDRDITRMVRRGELRRLRHGAYTFPAVWADMSPTERRMILARASLRCARAQAVLAGPSAADVLGAPTWNVGDHVHIARLDQRASRRRHDKAQHRGVILAEDITVRDGLPLTSGTKTALDMVALTDVPGALVTANGLLHAGETTPGLLTRRADAMAHDPYTRDMTTVLSLADGRCESAGESLVLHLCWLHGLPKPVLQYRVLDRWGNEIARVDFAWPELGVFLEFDGRLKYQRFRRPGESVLDMVLREKAREELICGLTGWRCIRLVWADLSHQQRTVGRITATLRGERWAA